jgi:hypothetical protein
MAQSISRAQNLIQLVELHGTKYFSGAEFNAVSWTPWHKAFLGRSVIIQLAKEFRVCTECKG